MSFRGFSLPEGAWFPPELMDILPDLETMSEIKVTLAALYETLRVGTVDAIISLTDFEALTGMDHKGVQRGIESAIKRGTFKRQKVGLTYLYRLSIQQSSPAGMGTMPVAGRGAMPVEWAPYPKDGHDTLGMMPVGSDVVVCDSFVLNKEDNNKQQYEERVALLAAMRDFGVKLKVAQKFVRQYDLEYLQDKLDKAIYAVDSGISDQNGPGWFVTSVKENWQAPLGYYDRDKPKKGSKEDRMRYITGKYAELIQH